MQVVTVGGLVSVIVSPVLFGRMMTRSPFDFRIRSHQFKVTPVTSATEIWGRQNWEAEAEIPYFQTPRQHNVCVCTASCW